MLLESGNAARERADQFDNEARVSR